MVSFTNFLISTKAAIDNTYTNKHVCVPIKLNLQTSKCEFHTMITSQNSGKQFLACNHIKIGSGPHLACRPTVCPLLPKRLNIVLIYVKYFFVFLTQCLLVFIVENFFSNLPAFSIRSSSPSSSRRSPLFHLGYAPPQQVFQLGCQLGPIY